MRRAGMMLGSSIAPPQRQRRLRHPPWRKAGCALAALALAGCSSFGLGQDPKPIDPNIFPADYKSGLIAYLQSNPFGLVGAREASLSPPELKAFGTESRYV